MSDFSIRRFPDPILREISTPIERIDVPLRHFIDSLIKTMHQQPGGIGIAAPQVGIPKRIAIVDVSKKERGRKRLVLINPTVVEARHPIISREGCMSLPDFTANVKRFSEIYISWFDVTV